ncbi:Dam family site-specific DNA-(adenine-N6)-methyltransferase [Algibacillus agarilyticus]|uniref:Dam family site-specific DNA-(adenine-N6)-methyltransferase n=1 Tax=Algibacillus agarilyticus TaxID=2234133 RepID=UPI000DD0800D|nr:Dam family site-specific DNA-(adenine-N6)-methyltransferase [Algibacillus agarilyticus]
MNKVRPFLKWAGGKYLLAEKISKILPKGDCLVEPFVGAGAIFLNSHNYSRYILNDINADLINLYRLLQDNSAEIIKQTQLLFAGDNNLESKYYELRTKFNESSDPFERSCLFIYLNRHGYNGLCRYNKSGIYNVPFGRYVHPYFPEKELEYFAEKSQNATFTCLDFEQVLQDSPNESVIYCDPPYASINPLKAASFTGYASGAFNDIQQQKLSELAQAARDNKQSTILISNHDTKFTRSIYANADKRKYLKVGRTISTNTKNRKPVKEVLALYQTAKRSTP